MCDNILRFSHNVIMVNYKSENYTKFILMVYVQICSSHTKKEMTLCRMLIILYPAQHDRVKDLQESSYRRDRTCITPQDLTENSNNDIKVDGNVINLSLPRMG